MGINVGAIEAILRLKDEFSAGIRAAQEKFSGLTSVLGGVKTAMATVGGVMAGLGFAMSLRHVLDLTGKLTDMSAKTGISTTELQKLKSMAEQSGSSLDQVTTAIGVMAKNLITGNGSAVEGMKRLGLSLSEIRQMAPDQAFATIADQIARIPSPMERATVATQIFGKSGADLLPMMSGNLKDIGDQAERSGIILSEATVAAGDEFGDSLGKLLTVGMALIGNVLGPFLPLLSQLVEWGAKAADVFGVVLTAAFSKVVDIGQKVFGWLADKIGKWIEFVKSVPGGLGQMFTKMEQGFNLLKDGATFVGEKIEGLRPKSDKANEGLDKLKFTVGATSEEMKKAAKEAEALAKATEGLVDRVNKLNAADRTRQLREEIDLMPHLNNMVQRNRQELALLLPVQRDINQMGVDYIANMQGMLESGEAFRNETVEQAGTVEQLVSRMDTWGNRLIRVSGLLASFGGGSETFERISRALSLGTDAGQSIRGGIGQIGAGNTADGLLNLVSGVTGAVGAMNEATKSGNTLSRTMGGIATGAKIGSMILPGWGTAIGAAAGAVVGLVRGLTNRDGRKAMLEFADSFGGVEKLQQKMLTLGPQYETMWRKFNEVGKGNVAQAKATLEEIAAAFDAQTAQATRAESAIQKYGFTFEGIGSKLQNSKVLEFGKELALDWDALVAAGVPIEHIAHRMGDAVSEFAQKAIATGAEVPASMKPMLEKMFEMGELVDENGEKLESLDDIKFAKTLTEGFDGVVKAVNDLKDALTKGVGGALDDLSKRRVRVPIEFDVDDAGLGVGSGGDYGFGAGASSTRSAATSIVGAATGGARNVTIVSKLVVDGSQLAESVARTVMS